MFNTFELDKIIEQENYSVFPNSPMQVMYYLASFPSEFTSLGVDFPNFIIEVIEAKFSSYLTCKIKVLAKNKTGQTGILNFFSTFHGSDKTPSHEVDIFWSKANVDM